METLEGKVALITGAARGIGLALSQALAEAGMRVVVADNDEDALRDAVDSTPLRGAAVPVLLDVRSIANWRQVVDAVCEDLSGIDVLCNNAGIGLAWDPRANPLVTWDIDPDRFQQVIDTNLIGTFNGIRTVVPRMLERNVPGHLVTTASMAGFLAPPHLGAYASSKFGVVALSECVAAELIESNIHVSIVCPGGVATAFNEAARKLGAGVEGGFAPDVPLRGPGPADAMKMDPASVADRVVAAIRSQDLYVFTHPEYAELVRERHRSVETSFGASAQPGYSDPSGLLQRSRSPIHSANRDR